MEKKNEYIDKLLHDLEVLDAKVSAIKREETIPFSFFRDAFQRGQEIMKLLHELEMLQIEDMKRQMEKLVLFLSENENKKPVVETRTTEIDDEDIEKVVEESEGVIEDETPVFSTDAETVVDDEKNVRRNVYAEGITLPTYTNPRNVESKMEVVIEKSPSVSEAEPVEEKPVIRSVNDIIKAPPAKLDIKRSLSLNDRFYYQRELFDNDRKAMNSMMLRLNAFDNYADTERYLREKTSWDFKDERVKSFLELLKKGFR